MAGVEHYTDLNLKETADGLRSKERKMFFLFVRNLKNREIIKYRGNQVGWETLIWGKEKNGLEKYESLKRESRNSWRMYVCTYWWTPTTFSHWELMWPCSSLRVWVINGTLFTLSSFLHYNLSPNPTTASGYTNYHLSSYTRHSKSSFSFRFFNSF